ncbi:MAG: pyridoxamine 5'-phosphate oxidase family protein [Candidatus Aenigmarchaeota archaeon]|nr:pyridoxamine 5'-phosphate oxidase family protein [Candidatus Aenigmarchaeota archaeon]
MAGDTKDLAIQAKARIRKILYITIATASKNCEPWNSPVYSAFDKSYTFYWCSWTENQHSRNIRENKNVFVVIYDSAAPEGAGFGVYMKGKAYQLGIENIGEIIKALKLLYGRKNKKPKHPREFLKLFPRRIFRFVPEKVWVNSEGSVKGNFVDTRVDITNEILK